MSTGTNRSSSDAYTGPFAAFVARGAGGQGSGDVARLVLVGRAASRDAPKRTLLLQAFRALQDEEVSVRYLVTPAGFASEHLEQAWPGTSRGWKSTIDDWEIVRTRAELIVKELLSDELFAAARGRVKSLCLGIDITYERDGKKLARGETAWLVDMESGRRSGATGKSYPTSKQEGFLVRLPDARRHLLDEGRVGVLVCHDLTVFNSRSRKNRLGRRKKSARALENAFRERKPAIVLHLAHTTDRSGTWSSAWTNLRSDLKGSIEICAGAFRYRTQEKRTPKRPLSSRLLRATADVSVITVVVADARSAAGLRNLM
jgi:hypothetical protein